MFYLEILQGTDMYIDTKNVFLTKYILAINSNDRGLETSYNKQQTSQFNSEGDKLSPTFRTSIS